MSRYIDADAYIKYCDENWIPLNVDAVNKQPTAKVAEVVRCEDCKWQRKRLMNNGYYWYECGNGNEALGLDGEFCSDGERKKEADTP